MRVARRLFPVVLGTLLLAGMGRAPTGNPMPSACDVLRALPADDLAGQSLEYRTTQDRAAADMRMSMCTALGGDDMPAVTLLLRQDLSAAGPQPASEARERMIAELTGSLGHAPAVGFAEIGEAAMWVEEIGQLTVWYRAGRVMLIVTAGGIGPKADEDLAKQVARGIVARFP